MLGLLGKIDADLESLGIDAKVDIRPAIRDGKYLYRQEAVVKFKTIKDLQLYMLIGKYIERSDVVFESVLNNE